MSAIADRSVTLTPLRGDEIDLLVKHLEPRPADGEAACEACGRCYPTPVELHHAEADCQPTPAHRLMHYLQHGDEYHNPLDEFVRLTERKRLEQEALRRTNGRLDTLEEDLLEQLAEDGESGKRHAATGKLVSISRRVWAKVARAGDKPTDEEKQRANAALKAAGLGDFVTESFNVQSLSSYFSEQARAHDEQQRLLPEHERRPLTSIADVLPAELVGAIDLNDHPTLSVRS